VYDVRVSDLGNYPKRTLLTGAGFTANWGGFVASRVWSQLVGKSDLRPRTAVQRVFREALGNFELALHLARHDAEISGEDRAAMETAVVEVFRAQEQIITDLRQTEKVNDIGVQELLSLFGRGRRNWGNMLQGIDTGFIFTLNQDWLVERLSDRNGHIFDTPVVPGVPVRMERFTETQRDFNINDIRLVPDTRPDRWPPVFRGNLNYLKLHGSFEWRARGGQRVLVVGGDKTTQIGEFEVLRAYFDVFERVLATGGMRLMVIGYAFGDDHINAAIARAVRESGLTLFVVDLRDVRSINEGLLSKGEDGKTIFDAIVGFSHDPFISTFATPRGEHRTVEYKRILEEFFDLKLP
jgi:hypothetical protein